MILHHDPVVIAAELLWELEQDRVALIRTSHDVSAALDWRAAAASPTYAELCDRRGEPERADRARQRMREAS